MWRTRCVISTKPVWNIRTTSVSAAAMQIILLPCLMGTPILTESYQQTPTCTNAIYFHSEEIINPENSIQVLIFPMYVKTLKQFLLVRVAMAPLCFRSYPRCLLIFQYRL